MIKSIYISIIFLLPFLSAAQESDAGGWIGIEVSGELNKKFNIGLKESFRFNENYLELGTVFTQLNLTRDLPSGFKIDLGYRLHQKRNLDNYYESGNRFALALSSKFLKLDKVDFSLRAQIQSNRSASSEKWLLDARKQNTRVRLKVNVALSKKVNIAIATEGFFGYSKSVVDLTDIRYTAKLSKRINKRHSISIGYLYQTEYNTKNKASDYITTIAYSYDLRKIKKRIESLRKE